MKVVGVGLNKTGTKTLKYYFDHWGLNHQSYDLEAFNLFRASRIEELMQWMERFDSFEDWPWPLMYQEIDQRFPDAKFILTTRKSPETWYRSLCKMAVRMGPFNQFEKHIYGYAMPQGRKQEHLAYYDSHNRAVRSYFANRPGKLLEICWSTDPEAGNKLADFLGREPPNEKPPNLNISASVYAGDNLFLAHLNRVLFQTAWYSRKRLNRLIRRLKRSPSSAEK